VAAVDPTADVGLDLAQVVVHRPVPVRSLARVTKHEIELLLHVLVPDQAPPVDVEVARRDRSDISPDPCELTDGGFGENGHCTSRSRFGMG
jgi:hypothetical protein